MFFQTNRSPKSVPQQSDVDVYSAFILEITETIHIRDDWPTKFSLLVIFISGINFNTVKSCLWTDFIVNFLKLCKFNSEDYLHRAAMRTVMTGCEPIAMQIRLDTKKYGINKRNLRL